MGKRGPAPGTGGRPRKSLDERLLDGQAPRVLKPKKAKAAPELPFPKPSDFLSSAQRLEIPLRAGEVYTRVYEWLCEFNCQKFVTKDTVELYALCIARWVQCEEAVSKIGFTGKHPTTGAPIASPYVTMSREYLKQAVAVWDRICATVRENASGDYNSNAPGADVMEMLLSGK